MIPEKGKNIGDEKFFAGTRSHTVKLLNLSQSSDSSINLQKQGAFIYYVHTLREFTKVAWVGMLLLENMA